jgi:hypothetical protein
MYLLTLLSDFIKFCFECAITLFSFVVNIVKGTIYITKYNNKNIKMWLGLIFSILLGINVGFNTFQTYGIIPSIIPFLLYVSLFKNGYDKHRAKLKRLKEIEEENFYTDLEVELFQEELKQDIKLAEQFKKDCDIERKKQNKKRFKSKPIQSKKVIKSISDMIFSKDNSIKNGGNLND